MKITILHSEEGWLPDEAQALTRSTRKRVHHQLQSPQSQFIGNELIVDGELTEQEVKKIVPEKNFSLRITDQGDSNVPDWYKRFPI